MNRRESRETVFTLLYETEFHPEKHYEDVYNFALETRDIKENDYIKDVFFGTCENMEKIDKIIEQAAVDWRIERMSKVTLSIIRLCVYELLYSLDVPTNVALNEAVELAKTYDIATAPAFVNGIVNRAAKIIEELPAQTSENAQSSEEE